MFLLRKQKSQWISFKITILLFIRHNNGYAKI